MIWYEKIKSSAAWRSWQAIFVPKHSDLVRKNKIKRGLAELASDFRPKT
jgi:hypothetical protein